MIKITYQEYMNFGFKFYKLEKNQFKTYRLDNKFYEGQIIKLYINREFLNYGLIIRIRKVQFKQIPLEDLKEDGEFPGFAITSIEDFLTLMKKFFMDFTPDSYLYEIVIEKTIRTDCYLAVKKKYEKTYPNAQFEVITRTINHRLSPTWSLLKYSKAINMKFEEYSEHFIKQLKNDPLSIKKIKELKEAAQNQILFLICYEKDPRKCHRSIIAELIKELERNKK